LFVFSFSKNLISFFYYGFGAVRYLQESYERGCFSLSLQGVLSRNESAPEEQKIRCDLRSMDFDSAKFVCHYNRTEEKRHQINIGQRHDD